MELIDREGPANADGRRDRWVGMWREAVRACTSAIALVDLSTTRFVELSAAAAQLFATSPEEGAGLDYLAVAERPDQAAETFRQARAGMLDGIRARRRFTRPDGSKVEVQSIGWAIRSAAEPDLGLWIACETLPERTSESTTAVDVDVLTPALSPPTGSPPDGARVTLDERWRVTAIGGSDDVLLGGPPVELVGRSFIDLTHPDDLAGLLFALARSTTERQAQAPVRLRYGDGSWRTVQVAPTVLEGDETALVAMVVADGAAPRVDRSGQVGILAEHLRRIAAQIEAAGLLAPLAETAEGLGIPVTTQLSPRQWEIAARLVRGQRVRTIAAEMYLSQSTVRNHLSAIFRKVGVHSQSELLALWRRETRGGPSTSK